MEHFDLLIVGSGPAGLSTAMHLLRSDPSWSQRMLLLEQAAHPRPKLCGGGVTLLGLRALEDLGFEYPLPIPGAEVDDVQLVYRGRTIHVRERPMFVVYHRPQLDAFLADQARQRGVILKENEAVTNLSVDSSGVLVETNQERYRAQVVVGADGSKGLTRRLVNGPGSKARVARLLEVLSPAAAGAPHFSERYALFEFSPVHQSLQGYFWEFPSWVDGSPVLNCGVYDARLVERRDRADLPGLLKAGLGPSKLAEASSRFQGHPIHWFSPRSRFAAPRLLLVGDAAGGDPLFGEGIAPALAYGKPAAIAIQEAFARQDFSFRNYKRRLFTSEVGRYLLLRWCVAWWSYRGCWSSLFMNVLWTIGNWAAWLRSLSLTQAS
jgi:flavin-dependent dehydrogenase